MSNCKEILIQGRVPFDIANNKDACLILGALNAPIFGYQIKYGKETFVPNANGNGGKTAYYEFTISGTEAVPNAWLKKLLLAFVNVAEVRYFKCEDIETGELIGSEDLGLEWGPGGKLVAREG